MVTDDDTGLKVLYEPSRGEASIEYANFQSPLARTLMESLVSSQCTVLALIQMILGVKMLVDEKMGCHEPSTGSRIGKCYLQQ